MPPKTTQKETPLTTELSERFNQHSKQPAGSITVDQWKALGNDCFANGSYLTAIKCYTKAIELPDGDNATLRSNRSAAYLKSSMFSGPAMALKDAERAVELNNTWYKGYLRVGDAQYAREKYEEAQKAYERALAFDGSCEAAKASLHQLKKDMFLRDLDRKQHEEWKRETTSTGMDPNGGDNKNGSSSAAPRQPMEFHNAEFGADEDPTGRRRQPTEDETALLIRTLKEDVSLRDDRTGMKARAVTLDSADRTAGVAYKDRLLSTFRKKVDTTDGMSDEMQKKREADLLKGDGVDYKDADKHRKQYAKATNGIGHGISADSYKEFTFQKDSLW